jgi:hypothetical protein
MTDLSRDVPLSEVHQVDVLLGVDLVGAVDRRELDEYLAVGKRHFHSIGRSTNLGPWNIFSILTKVKLMSEIKILSSTVT